MEFTKDEKEVLRNLIKKQLKELEQNESMSGQTIEVLGNEVKYGEFLANLLKKID